MMKIALTLVISIITTLSFGQFGNNPQLDEHRNFKEIKLGDLYNDWASHLTLRTTDGSVSQYYVDLNFCCKTLFEFEVELVTVLIKGDKIVSIKIDLKKFQESMTSLEKGFSLYHSIEGQFNTLFGKFYATAPKDTNPLLMSQWLGNKTVLETRYNYYGLNNGDRVEVKISDLEFLMSELKSGF